MKRIYIGIILFVIAFCIYINANNIEGLDNRPPDIRCVRGTHFDAEPSHVRYYCNSDGRYNPPCPEGTNWNKSYKDCR